MQGLKKGRYRHHTGKKYEFLDIVTDTETDENIVVYRELFDKFNVLVCPESVFTGYVPGSGKVPIFQWIED